MSLQTEYKLRWPEYRIEFHPTEEIPKKVSLQELWPDLRAFFSGNQSRFANYLFYLSTDFSGGFSLCSVLSENDASFRFHDPVLQSPTPFPKTSLERIWKLCQNREFEEMEREDWELIGYGLLYEGNVPEFRKWVLTTKEFFGQTDDNRRFLTLLGWEYSEFPFENSILHMLVEYAKGNFEKIHFPTLVDAALQDSHWQLVGILFHAIELGLLPEKEAFRVWKFMIGFYEEWETWEKEKFQWVSIGKIPPFSALRYAKRYLPHSTFLKYKSDLETELRGDWMNGNEFGYELSHTMNPCIDTVVRYKNEGELFERELSAEYQLKPYSYLIPLQLSCIHFVKKEYDQFIKLYQKSGRLKHLPLALNLYWRVLQEKGDKNLSSAIKRSLENGHESITLPEGWE
ncbi:hypothetical protein EHR04_16045 [Leptospira levettii]|uniref:LBF_1011 family protein n=1 Tax=Leptospira levettii TaxID=2023178 RepID=UPI000C2B39BC|nr:hypothetical protein [Leptospira levettii]PKA24925.1 hypothetical protein CH381_18090 [Leptospira sp. mixed culture ATI2-C-A1]TGM32547.1 hypothetical protein EHQ71_01610 [Leptospira levettii]TGM76991.1 hypothetical protein EHR04_16045 [Leptospira levettii]